MYSDEVVRQRSLFDNDSEFVCTDKGFHRVLLESKKSTQDKAL